MLKSRVAPLMLLLVSLLATSCARIETRTPASQAPETAPDFTLGDHLGGTFQLSEALAKGPVAIVFYRGHW